MGRKKREEAGWLGQGKAFLWEGNGMVTLNEVVPFAWDTVYTFAPYTPRKDIEAVIGFQSAAVQETVSEGMVQLLFVKGDVVAACICGYPENLGYQVTLKHSVEYKDNVLFQIETDEILSNLSSINHSWAKASLFPSIGISVYVFVP